VPTFEVSRTLVKSPPELREELRGERLGRAIEGARVDPGGEENSIAWEADGVKGTARLDPSGWGTRVTLTAEVEEQVAELGFWARMRGIAPPPPRHSDMERRLEQLLDELGSAHKKPFQGS
jgi:hypothetical protein